MKATLPIAAVCLGGMFALIALSSPAEAGVVHSAWLGAVVLGQSNAEEPDGPMLLSAAREAMEKGQLTEAEAYIQRAENRWGMIHLNPWTDTPAKARRDLQKLRTAGTGAGGAQRPSQKSQPSLLSLPGSGPKKTPTDPFQNKGADVDALMTEKMTDKKPDATTDLKKGRLALEQGNMSAAVYFARRAADVGATFGPNEDSPARLAEDIRRHGGNPDQTTPSAGAFPVGVPGEEDNRSMAAAVEDRRPVDRPMTPGREITPLQARGEGPARAAAPPQSSLYGPSTPAAAQSEAGGRASDGLLLEARRALSGGDTRRALTLSAQARSLNESYGPLDDSPTKIDAMVRRYSEVQQRRSSHVDSEAANRMYAQLLLEEAEGLLQWQDYETAERLAADAQQLPVEFAPFENNPTTVLQRIASLQRGRTPGGPPALRRPAPEGVQQATYDAPHDGTAGQPTGAVAAAVYDPQHDDSRTLRAADDQDDQRPGAPPALAPANGALGPQATAVPATPTSDGGALPTPMNSASQWVKQGDEALAHKDQKTAMEFYLRAAAHRDQLDPATAQHLQNCLQLAQASAGKPAEAKELLDETTTVQQRLKQQVSNDVVRESRRALDMREQDPLGAINQLKKTRAMVEQSALTAADKKLLLKRIDSVQGETQKFVDQHRSDIDLTERNKAVRADVDQGRMKKVQVQERLALLVNDYNKLRDEQRFPEAEATAKQAREIAPNEPVVVQMWREIHFYKFMVNNQNLRDEQANKFAESMYKVQESATAYGDDTNPERFIEKADWVALSQRREKFGKDTERKRSPKEIEIEQKLRTPVSLSFKEAPLSEVMDYLKRVTAVNIFVDPQGLAQEGVHPSTPITIELSQDISLQSALNLILGPLHLAYVVKDEVLKVTSEQYRSGNLITKVYNVADLVIPIPDFMPTSDMGLPKAIQAGYGNTTANLAGGGFQTPIMSMAANGGPNKNSPQNVLAQQTNTGGGLTTGGVRGGSSGADFDGIIDLITKTIEPSSWDSVGGAGSVKESAGNLSLVVSQTQEVHEKISDLLQQLRRLQDLQVTIEVRFITLSDNFFERIGVDFDFNYRGNATQADVARAASGARSIPSATIGLDSPTPTTPFPNFTPNGAIPFRNNSFNAAVPPFGGFDPASAATFGIAILSDIEAFFLVQAAQGDVRSNIMQAPKVTLFNGQAASISDQSQTPFVTSVTPVVGDFAAAQAPVIVVLNEGTTLSVQAVVSPDRRFVRLTLIPFFSQIGDVKEFMFTGSTTTNSSSADASSDMGDTTSNSDTSQVVKEGTTIQLPTFIYTTVTTTVSVPDGGTVLLGGVKRLKEGRNEQGVPIMSKIPYINRLFKNVGIGREAQSLMLMVTPRIIIQEEEEERLGLAPSTP